MIRDIAGRQDAEDLLREKVFLIKLLQEVTAAANEAASVTAGMQTCVDLVCQYLGWPVGHCYLINDDSETLISSVWHLDRADDFALFHEVTENTPIRVGHGLVGAVAFSRQPRWIEDLSTLADFPRRRNDADVRVKACFAFPVLSGSNLLGVLEFFTDRVTKVDPSLMETLPQIGAQIGRLIEREKAAIALRKSEDQYRDLVEESGDMICTHDMEGNVLSANQMMGTVLGLPPAELVGHNIREFLVPEYRSQFDDYLVRISTEGRAHGLMKMTDALGNPRIVEYRNTRRTGGLSQPIARGVARDVTEQFRAQQALSRSERRYRLLFERNLAGIARMTIDGEVIECNDALARMLGHADSATMLRVMPPPLQPLNDEWGRILGNLVSTGLLSNVELCFATHSGALMWTLANLTYQVEDSSAPVEAIFLDITERKAAEERVEFQAYHDALTRLPNRFLFRDRLARAIRDRRWRARGLALLYVDLDGFKEVNDFFGHSVGDYLLKEIAARLTDDVRSSDTIARMGGDEFAVILSGLEHSTGAALVAQKLIDAIARPFAYGELELHVTASIGVALFPQDGADEETLLRSADEAMYLAKSSGKNAFRLASAGS